MDERLDLIAEEGRKKGGISLSTLVSILVHAGLILLFLKAYRTPPEIRPGEPAIRFVELIRSNPREFVEAPGPAIPAAPSPTAPLSDANRRASIPQPTGSEPTRRPGDGSGLYTPPMSPAAPQTAAAPPAGNRQGDAEGRGETAAEERADASSRIPALRSEASLLGEGVNWRSAIKEVGKMASIAGGEGFDLSGAAGGEKGFAEAGPLSFETQWYDWGEYAQSMVSRIRVNWYNQMPQLIRTGLQGVVTIRFTIQRNGRITEVTLLKSSGVPPYDFAARKAIELSSPLNPLPADFPNPSERVTAMFYYNMQTPR